MHTTAAVTSHNSGVKPLWDFNSGGRAITHSCIWSKYWNRYSYGVEKSTRLEITYNAIIFFGKHISQMYLVLVPIYKITKKTSKTGWMWSCLSFQQFPKYKCKICGKIAQNLNLDISSIVNSFQLIRSHRLYHPGHMYILDMTLMIDNSQIERQSFC